MIRELRALRGPERYAQNCRFCASVQFPRIGQFRGPGQDQIYAKCRQFPDLDRPDRRGSTVSKQPAENAHIGRMAGRGATILMSAPCAVFLFEQRTWLRHGGPQSCTRKEGVPRKPRPSPWICQRQRPGDERSRLTGSASYRGRSVTTGAAGACEQFRAGNSGEDWRSLLR